MLSGLSRSGTTGKDAMGIEHSYKQTRTPSIAACQKSLNITPGDCHGIIPVFYSGFVGSGT